MPVVFREAGYKFFFYSNEGDPREPLHIHVRGKGVDAKIWLEPNLSVQESYGMNSKELANVVRMVERRIELIRSVWNEHFGN
jgi:hypothetical protein